MLDIKFSTDKTSLEETKKYIYSIDFSRIISKLVNQLGWLKNDAEETCRHYRNFLFLNKKYAQDGMELSPSEDIDEFWHNHILDTEAYIKDCENIFGRYLHHYPYFGIDDKTTMKTVEQAFSVTQKLYFEEFGEYIQPTRSGYPKFFYYLMKKLPLLDVT